MSEFLKPQSPLSKDGAYFYPLTTADQVILDDNNRLNYALEHLVYIDDEHQESVVVPLNADTLGGHTVDSLIDKIYPIGSIYMSVNSVSPATLFGGIWEQMKDAFLLAAGDTYAAGTTGGEAEHALTKEELPNYNLSVEVKASNAGLANYTWLQRGWADNGVSIGGGNITVNSGGSDLPHNNMPPYLAVYMWKRTA